MTMNEYLAELKFHLASLPAEERDAALKYYKEFFEDAGSDEEAIRELGSPETLAQTILGETNRTEKSSSEYIPATQEDLWRERTQNTADSNARGSNNVVLVILLLILLSPILIPIAAVVFSLFVAALAVVFSIWVACGGLVLGLTVGGVAAFIGGVALLFVAPLEGIMAIGTGLVLTGIGLLLLIPFVMLTSKAIPAVIRGFVNLISWIFNRNKVVAHA